MSGQPYIAEYLSKDIFEEHFLKSFLPFHILQLFLGTCRVDAKYRFITAPSNYQKLYSCVCLIVVAFNEYLLIDKFVLTRFRGTFVDLLSIFIVTIQFILYAFNIIETRFFSSSANVHLYLKLQQVDRLLIIDQTKILNNIMFNRHLLTLGITILLFLIMIFVSLQLDSLLIVIIKTISMMMVTSMHLELTLFYNFTYFLTIRLKFFNEILTQHKSVGNVSYKSTGKVTTNWRISLDKTFFKTIIRNSSSVNLEINDMSFILEEILECYSLVKNIFKNWVGVIIYIIIIYTTIL